MSTPNRRRESRVKRSDDCKTELSVPHSTVSTSTLRTIPIPVASVLQLDGSGGFRNTCRWSCTPATVTTAPTTNPLTEVVDAAMTTCSFSDGLTVTVDSVSICEVCDATPRRLLSSSECPATQVSQRSFSTECGRGLDVRVVSPVRALPPPPNRSCSPLVYACGRKAATSVPRTCSSGCLGEHPHVNGPLAAGTGDRTVGHPLERVAAPAAAVQLSHGKHLPPQVIMSPSSVSSEFQQSCQLHLAHGGGGSIDTFLDELEEHDAPHLFPFLLHLQFSASRSRISADSSASPTLEPRRDSQSTGALVASRDINDTPPDLPWLRLFLPLAEDVRDEVGTASSARSTPSVASSNSFPPHVYRRRTVKKYKLAHPRRATRNASANTARRGNLIDPQTSRSTPPRPNPPSAKPLLTPLSTRIRRRSFPNASALPTCDGEDMQRKTDQVGLCEVVEPFGPYPYSWRSFSDNVLSQTPPQ